MSNVGFDREAYEGMLIAVLAASQRKIYAGLRYAGTEEFQDYPPGIIEVGTALDAVDMAVKDIMNFIEANADEPYPI